MNKPVILTGLRANNDLHIGNYFGALLPLIAMAKTRAENYQINLFVPDLHSFTTPIDHSQLQTQIMHNLKLFVAAGLPLNQHNIHIYRQSYVPAHSELTWILDCFTGYGEMSRMTQFKDKASKSQDDRISMGLFNYPVLMAADILLYGASYVPVGDDQSQHVEFARDIAMRLNNQFGDLLTVPEPVKKQHEFFGNDAAGSSANSQGLRIKDLVDPAKKMSKSDESGRGIIFLGDNPDEAAKKIKSATTDSFGKIDYHNQPQPGISNLLQILTLISGASTTEISDKYYGQEQYGPLKADVAEAVHTFLSDFQKRLALVDELALLAKLVSDEADMNVVANATLLKVQRAVGLRA